MSPPDRVDVDPEARPRSEREIDEATMTELISELTHDVGDLISTQVQLAVAEVKDDARLMARAGEWLGIAAVLGYLTLLLTSFTIAWALADWFDEIWLGFLVIAVVMGVAAFIAYSIGRQALKDASPTPSPTIDTLQEDKEWLQQQMS